MISEKRMIRSSERVTDYIEKYITLVGVDKRDEVLTLFDSMHRLFPYWVIAICPKMHPDIHYLSRNAPHFFGYESLHLTQNSLFDEFFPRIHEADQADLVECFDLVHDRMAALPPEEQHLLRAVFHYRFRKPDGQYIYLHDEKASLWLRDHGHLYYVLFRDLTSERAFTGVKVELYLQGDILRKIEEYKPASRRSSLSKREKELLGLIRQGLSTKEIAWYLKISQYTVRNIKSRMFEKFNVSNSIELLNMAG